MGSYNYYRVFGFFHRKFRVKESQPPFDVKEAFLTYSGKGTHMTTHQLLRFLIEFQGEDRCTEADAEGIINQILHQRHHLTHFTHKSLSLEDFFNFLFQDGLNGPIRSEVHHDMTAPLQHYFIYTGHNSYLTGNQLSSDCSEIPIIKALERGVRVIELDLWPNSTKDNVHVLHGRTLTAPIPLIKCLKSIKEHAFVKSPYPVILTLEDHLTPALQSKVAEMVTAIFGEMLYYPAFGPSEEFPSPEALKHRIILSTKPPKEYLEKHLCDKETTVSLDKELSEDELQGKEISDPEAELDERTESDHDDDDGNIYYKRSGQVGALEYKHLIAIHAGKPKMGLQHSLVTGIDRFRRLSLSEQLLERAASSYGTDVVRVYPKGTRVTSTNFRPFIGWMHGAQMVAFNMQGYGKSLMMMQGMFKSNGGCGYVKKPDFLMAKGPNNDVFDPKVHLPVKQTLKVSIYMGDGWRMDFSHTHFDAYSPPDFYTKIYLEGVPADVVKKKTRVIEDDWSPVWDESFIFPLTVPELALIRIIVKEYDRSEKDDFGGQTCLPVSELRPGIRAVPLYNEKGEKYKSVKLLMRFQFV